ncbi:MAG: hypothetical protein ACOCUO_01610 [archaeon]
MNSWCVFEVVGCPFVVRGVGFDSAGARPQEMRFQTQSQRSYDGVFATAAVNPIFAAGARLPVYGRATATTLVGDDTIARGLRDGTMT